MSGPGWEIALIDSAWHGTALEGPAGLVRARELGYEALDLFVGFDPRRKTDAEHESYLAGVAAAGLPVRSLVCTCLGLSDFNDAVREYHVERACAVVDLTAELPTVRNLLFVPGEYMFQRRLLPAAYEWERVVDATRRVGARATERGLEVAIELLPFEFAFVRSLYDMERLLDEVGLPNVKAAIDVSHLWLERIEPSALGRLAGRVAQVHLADCDGENHGDLPPGRGTTPFPAYLAKLHELGYRGSVSVELEFPRDGQPVEEWVAEALGATRRLLADGGQRPDLAA
jgi:D-psicose/D-tagatose/L-ribulose 3-epimerase